MGRKIVIFLFLQLFISSCYDSFDGNSVTLPTSVPDPNCKIEYLHSIYADGIRRLNQDFVIDGYVTANDQSGNFFKSFVVQSGGYSLEVLVGLYDSHVDFPLGSKVRLFLNGLALDRRRGVLQLGLYPPSGSSRLDYMGSKAVVDQYVIVYKLGDLPTPQNVNIDDLLEVRCGELLTIDNLKYIGDGDVVEESIWSGYKLFVDEDRDSVWSYTSEYADFARMLIPLEKVSLTGILQYGSDKSPTQYSIKMRSDKDCVY